MSRSRALKVTSSMARHAADFTHNQKFHSRSLTIKLRIKLQLFLVAVPYLHEHVMKYDVSVSDHHRVALCDLWE